MIFHHTKLRFSQERGARNPTFAPLHSTSWHTHYARSFRMRCRSVPLLSIHRNPHASGHQLFALEPVPHTGLAGKCTIARPPAVAFDGDTLEILHNIRG